MDFTIPPDVEDLRLRTRAFIDEQVIPLEADAANYDQYENIRLDLLEGVRAKARAARPVGAAVAQGIRRHGASDRRLGGDV